jgi:transposase InsO family protein
LAWRLSITMEAAFCVETLEDALARYGKPDVNTDQGSQFTGAVFTGVLASDGITISMDSKGAWRDNVFVGPVGCRRAFNLLLSAMICFSCAALLMPVPTRKNPLELAKSSRFAYDAEHRRRLKSFTKRKVRWPSMN